MQVNKWQREAAFRLSGCGLGSLPTRGATRGPHREERCLSPSSGCCLKASQTTGKVRRGRKREGEMHANEEKKANQQHKCKAEKRKRQLKRKYKDAISESAENKVSSVGLTRATKTTSCHARASASILRLALGEWHRPVAGCSAAYTFFLKKNTLWAIPAAYFWDSLQGNLSVILMQG